MAKGPAVSAASGGARLFVEDPGGPRPRPLLVHGSMDRSTSFARVARRLAELGPVRYDRRGYGRSLAAGAGALAAHTDDLLAVANGSPTAVVGHSFGGLVALRAAVTRPEIVRAVVAYEPPTPWWPGWPSGSMTAPGGGDDPAEVAETFLRGRIGDQRWRRLGEGYRSARRAEGTALVTETASVPTDRPVVIADELAVPVVLARGTVSPAHHRDAVDAFAAGLGVPVDVVAGADHHAPLSAVTGFAALVERAVALATGARGDRG